MSAEPGPARPRAGEPEDLLPVTPLQRGLLFHSAFDDTAGVDVYTTQTELEIDGPVDPERMRAALRAVLAAQPQLRAGFRLLDDGRHVAVVPHRVDVPLRVVDLSGRDPGPAEAEACRQVATDRLDRFDPARPPLVRLLLVRFAEDRWRLDMLEARLESLEEKSTDDDDDPGEDGLSGGTTR